MALMIISIDQAVSPRGDNNHGQNADQVIFALRRHPVAQQTQDDIAIRSCFQKRPKIVSIKRISCRLHFKRQNQPVRVPRSDRSSGLVNCRLISFMTETRSGGSATQPPSEAPISRSI